MDPKIKEHLLTIKGTNPLILNIAKNSPENLTEKSLLSIGARVITIEMEQEVEELIQFSKAIIINIDKADDEFIKLCERVSRIANQWKKPIILDPLGTGASHLRTDSATKLMQNSQFSIVRVNSIELTALLNPQSLTFDNEADDLVIEHARSLSKKFNATIVVNGKTNAVINLDKIEYFHIDSILQFKMVGINNLITSMIGAFHAIEENRYIAAVAALDFYQFCVKTAEMTATGPESFKTKLIDEIYINSSLAI